ncbi:forespore capture DNA-binding protein RefZ [Oceanobacillus jordanicus]|uniref:Forespore capture DNA-binding protein RefZ n=1 Tax=Oceanobacillus jordanicus TaxID=2867266 RepID=A0AAW5BAM7_9BACI|nr:forespore capture DNA-binding protein RefZ [Oceanobacillus jordanicus]MCG3420199.1 forespore capture DNA-binding protein RefZ [Oceanobacillus jordanicus]
MKPNTSKQKVIDAASSLFFQKGFHGTSVRDIAERASVNVSLISYYFKGKQGLLEYAVSYYYEAYLIAIEETLLETEQLSALDQLKELISTIIHYKQMHHQFSCFIHRELSLDSVFVREMAVTYLAKENFYVSKAFEAVIRVNKKTDPEERSFLLMQFKGMLTTPYILHNEWKNQVVGQYSHRQFAEKYVKSIHHWIDFAAKEPADKTASS